jgi:type VII secretion-associated serine protease mycosin
LAVIKVTRRLGALAVVVAWLATVTGLAVPAAAQTAAGGTVSYTPSANEWWLKDFQVQQQVWPLTEGAGVTVAVVDSGVQASVPDLRGVVLRGGDMLGDPGNGDQDYATSQDGHGTAVAVLIAGQGYGTGTVGIAPQAKILPVHVDAPVRTDEPALIAGIEYAVNHGASVINLSISSTVSSPTSCDPTLQEAIANALAHNVVVVASSGDVNLSGPGPVQPASCAGVLAVGGIEPDLSLWPETVQQPYVSLAAPGAHMVYVGMDGQFTTIGAGTSFSSPLVAGAAALIRSRYPSMPWYQVVQRLIGTAIPKGSPDPNNGYGYGILDPAKAVNASAYPVSASFPNPVYGRYLAWLQSPEGQSWAKANGVTVPSTTPAQGPGGKPAGTTPAASSHSGSGGLGATGILVVVVVACIVLGGLSFLFFRARMRSGAGPGGPGAPYGPGPYGPGGVPPGYGPQQYGNPPQQYGSPGGYPPPGYGPGGYSQQAPRREARPQDQDSQDG